MHKAVVECCPLLQLTSAAKPTVMSEAIAVSPDKGTSSQPIKPTTVTTETAMTAAMSTAPTAAANNADATEARRLRLSRRKRNSIATATAASTAQPIVSNKESSMVKYCSQ